MAIEKYTNGFNIAGEEIGISYALSASCDDAGNNISEYYQPSLSAGDGIEITEDNEIKVKLHYITVGEP